MRIRLVFYSIFQLVIFGLSFVSDWYIPLILTSNILLLVMILDKLGKGIVLREIIALHTAFISLLMPLAGYNIYNQGNDLAFLWRRFMPIPQATYFNYALPAISGFILFLCLPIFNSNKTDEGIHLRNTILKAKAILHGNQKIGITLIILGVLTPIFVTFLPVSLQYVFNLFFFSSFAGFLYVYFSGSFSLRNAILFLFGIFIIFSAIIGGMFTIVAYMGMTLFSFFFIGRETSLFKKSIIFVVAIILVFIVQTIKPTYRYLVWKKNYEGNKAALFGELMYNKISSKEDFLSKKAFFPIYYRTNHGYNLALVMRRFPKVEPHDNGSHLFFLMASSFVPRVIWPDKPEAGGLANMKYYTGITLRRVAMNVGPVGEAYASFGRNGGILYMVLLGLFIRWAYTVVFSISKRIPTMIFWIPVLFYQVSFSAENDTLQILNSLFKTGIFIYIFYKLKPIYFLPFLKKNSIYKGRLIKST